MATSGDGYQYSFNPCYPFDEGTCTSVAGCQIEPSTYTYYDIGSADKVTLSYDEANDYLVGTYIAGDEARTSKVHYQCDPETDPPVTAVQGETAQSTYTFAIVSKYVCPQPEPGPGPGPKPGAAVNLSIGSILVIVFVSIVSVYLISGLLFNKFYRKESGRNVLPNLTFWGALPGLVKEGVRFSFSKVRRREYEIVK